MFIFGENFSESPPKHQRSSLFSELIGDLCSDRHLLRQLISPIQHCPAAQKNTAAILAWHLRLPSRATFWQIRMQVRCHGMAQVTGRTEISTKLSKVQSNFTASGV